MHIIMTVPVILIILTSSTPSIEEFKALKGRPRNIFEIPCAFPYPPYDD